jgi:hypothetical protein
MCHRSVFWTTYLALKLASQCGKYGRIICVPPTTPVPSISLDVLIEHYLFASTNHQYDVQQQNLKKQSEVILRYVLEKIIYWIM